MSKILGLDWMLDGVYAAEIDGTGREIGVSAKLLATPPAELLPQNAGVIAEWLSYQLKAAGFSARDVVITVPRQRVSLKALEVPPCPADELPALVQFAAEGELPVAGGTLDFQMLRQLGATREILAAVLPTAVVTACQQVCKLAQLNLRRVSPRAYAWHALACRAAVLSPYDRLLLVNRTKSVIELSIWNQDVMMLWRSIPTGSPDAIANRVFEELQRTLAVYDAREVETRVQAIALLGFAGVPLETPTRVSTGLVVAQLAARADLGVDLPDADENLLGAVATAFAEQRRITWPIDFLQHKKAVAKRDVQKSTRVLAGVLAGVVVLGGFYSLHRMVAGREEEIQRVTQELASVTTEVDDLKKGVLKHHKEVKDWVNVGINWLEELQNLSATFPDTEHAFLTHAEFTVGTAQKKANIKLTLQARDAGDVLTTHARWREDDVQHYEVTPILQGTTDEKAFPLSFQLELGVVPFDEKNLALRAGQWSKLVRELTPTGFHREPVRLGDPAGGVPGAERSRRMDRRFERPAATTPTGTMSPTTPMASTPAAEAAAESGDDYATKLIAKLKAMSYEDREKYLRNDVKAYMRNYIRKRLEENK